MWGRRGGGRVLEYQSGIMLTWVDVGKGVTFLWARKHRLFLPFSSFLSMIGYPDCHQMLKGFLAHVVAIRVPHHVVHGNHRPASPTWPLQV